MSTKDSLGILNIFFDEDIVKLKISVYGEDKGNLIKEIDKTISDYERIIIRDIILPRQLGKKRITIVLPEFKSIDLQDRTIIIR